MELTFKLVGLDLLEKSFPLVLAIKMVALARGVTFYLREIFASIASCYLNPKS